MKVRENTLVKVLMTVLIGLSLVIIPHARAQEIGTAVEVEPAILATETTGFVNPLSFVEQIVVCGDIQVQGTPIAGNASGSGNSGTITIGGIPATATVVKATLYWTVLTNSDAASNKGQNISFDSNAVVGTKIGFSLGETPCFPQDNTFAWKADVTNLVSSPGNGIYTVSDFPGGNQMNGDDFTEGVTLIIVYSDPSIGPKIIVSYEGLAVTNSLGETLTQKLEKFETNASGPVSVKWIPVIGNGQFAWETITFADSLGSIDFSDDLLLDGGTSEIAAGNCSYTDSATGNCFWDDDQPDVSSVFDNSDTEANVSYTLTSDCHSFVAMHLVVSTDADALCAIGGVFVDEACPPTDPYRNHGEYVSCVAHAAEDFLDLFRRTVSCFSCYEIDEIQSCIVNPRARSDVGK